MMKRFLLILLSALGVSGAVAMTVNKSRETMSENAEGRHLTALWAEYDKAAKADKPQQMAEILGRIKAEAVRRRYAEDFYEAGTKYIDAVRRRNWKEVEEARKEFAQEVEAFGEPLVKFLWMNEYGNVSSAKRFEYAQEQRAALQSGRHAYFYKNLPYMGGVMGDFIADDYEYALWRLLSGRNLNEANPEKDAVYQALHSHLAGRYPCAAYLEFYVADRLPEDKSVSALDVLARKYADRAIGFWPRQALLQKRWSSLNESRASSEAYKAFLSECEAFERERAALQGDEKTIASKCTAAGYLISELKSEGIGISVSTDTVRVSFRNLKDAEVTVYQGEDDKKEHLVLTRTVRNSRQSFYVTDEESWVLPRLNDGKYTVKAVSGKHSSEAQYHRHTLSVAMRRDKAGWAVYAADYKTGAPVEKATLNLYSGDRLLFAAADFAFQGFTQLPGEMQTALDSKDRNFYVECTVEEEGYVRRSKQLSVSRWGNYFGEGEASDGIYCNLYKDRGAYHPGDTVKFKAVLCKGNLVDRIQAVEAGMQLEAKLYDHEHNVVASQDLETGRFGSAAGEFVIPEGLRNGYFNIMLYRKDSDGPLGYTGFIVDEFVLPAFEVNFEKNDKLYLPGDTIEVKGQLRSYSGHSLGSARIRAKVMLYSTVVAEMDAAQEADGAFAIRFPAAESGYYSVEVTVSDETGETQTYSAHAYVDSYLYVNVNLDNAADGEFDLIEEDGPGVRPVRGRRRAGISKGIVQGEEAVFSFTVHNSNGDAVALNMTYELQSEKGETLEKGIVHSGETRKFDLTAHPSGLYRLVTGAGAERADGEPVRDERDFVFLKVTDRDAALDAPVSRFFLSSAGEVESGDRMRVQFGCADGPVWAVAELFGKDYELLESRTVHLDGGRGAAGSLTSLEWEYKESYPDAVMLYVFYFRSGKSLYYNHSFRRVRHALDLPIEFSSFEDRTAPATKYTFTLKTLPGVEAVAAVFDKSLDAFASNLWETVALKQFMVYAPGISSESGSVGEVWTRPRYAAYGSSRAKASNAAVAMAAMETIAEDFAEEDAAPFQMEETKALLDAGAVPIRQKFSAALTFQPFLRSDADGNISFSFSTSDKLSTYHVQVFAHDKDMRNGLITKDMMVTIPVKVSVMEPPFLYVGDEYRLAATVSNNTEAPVSGQVYCDAGEGSGPIGVPLTVPAGGEEAVSFAVPSPSGAGSLDLKVVFVSEEFTDGVLVSVPVYAAEQTLTESHSAALLPGMSRDSLLADLRGRFVNAPAADCSEISLLDRVKEALPSKSEPSGKDVLSLSEAYYVRLVAGRLRDGETGGSDSELLEKILACRNQDGGFGWFEGMKSSQVITAVLLERFAKLREDGFSVPDMTASVKYLDQSRFGTELPYWCGWVSVAQYLHVRSMYASVPFEVQTSGDFSKRMAEFRKYVQDYLTPKEKDGRGLEGRLLDKARRIRTLYNLSASGEGLALSKAWGIRFGTAGKLDKSMEADVASLLEYAVRHPDGGYYYPNAVMPFRGLLESEAYAHSLICDLLTDVGGPDGQAIADGIRLWLMLQKETQQWGEDPAYVDAIHSVLSGSEAVKATRIWVYKAEYTRPFSEIQAAGNGFTIVRKFYRAVTVTDEDSGKDRSMLQEIASGTALHRGEKIVARYEIWNQENRSFVKLTAPREAALRPVQQLSGHYGWWMSPLRIGGAYSISPQGYRNVKADRTEYFFDSYPEEKTEIAEEFFVTQDGIFTAPVVAIESLYAPHYRANDAFHGRLTVEDP